MSFTSDVKEELSHVEPVCSHCTRSLLAALIRMEGSLHLAGSGQVSLEVNTDSANVARLVKTLLPELYQLQTELIVRRSVLHKTPNYLIEVPMQEGLVDALRDLGVLMGGDMDQGISKKLINKRCCAAAYLRGAFLGSGFISSPKGDFHFEMTIENEALANDIVELLHDNDINAKVMARRNNFIVYMKSGSAITAFLALVGAHQAALTMENIRVTKSIRNDVNRRVNAEMANEHKSAEARTEQVIKMRDVLQHYSADALPPALQEVIRLRIDHPHATLKELGEFADPPLSKSAIYHRIRRIEQLADEIER